MYRLRPHFARRKLIPRWGRLNGMSWRQQRDPKQQAPGRDSKHLVGAWAAVAIVVLGLTSSEQPLAQKLRFEVASIRQGERTRQEGAGSPSLKVLPDRVEISNTPLRTLVRLAFDTKDYNSAWPDSLNPRTDERLFDVRATLPPGTTREQVPAMLQALLQERFGLVSHIETRNVAVYELVVPSRGIDCARSRRSTRWPEHSRPTVH
jgi:hypothetical protein